MSIIRNTQRGGYVDQVGFIALSQIIDDRRLIEIGQISHVIRRVEFRRIDFVNFIRPHSSIDSLVIAPDLKGAVAVILRDPSLDKRELIILEPKPSLARELG
jgi:hypothetical protein